eukprot:Tamp_03898.p1 GENE.Tamp_03898~~Tamp_03898.p1  ORF type:complete len:1023 (+),score=231.23 Tamp_03898:23-3070(+)
MALRASLASLATVLLLLLLPAHTDWVAPAAAREECAGVGRQTLAPGAVRALRLRGGAGGAGGGGVPSTPHGAEHTDPAWLWEREFDQLAGPSSQSRHRAAFFSAPQQESEGGESLFRQAFFLTHYRLDFAVARQLLERVLVLNPQHVPALTTLGQLLYLAYNDYDMAEGVLSRALQIEPGHLLARMHVDLVRSLRRAAALLPYQPLAPPRRVAYAQAAAVKMDDAAWDERDASARQPPPSPWAVGPQTGANTAWPPAWHGAPPHNLPSQWSGPYSGGYAVDVASGGSNAGWQTGWGHQHAPPFSPYGRPFPNSPLPPHAAAARQAQEQGEAARAAHGQAHAFVQPAASAQGHTEEWGGQQQSAPQQSAQQPSAQQPAPQASGLPPSSPRAGHGMEHTGQSPASRDPSAQARPGAAVRERYPQLGNINYPATPPAAATPLAGAAATFAAPSTPSAPPQPGAAAATSTIGGESSQGGQGGQGQQGAGKPQEAGEMPEGAPSSIEERLAHSKWNVRGYAYQELACAIYRLATAPQQEPDAESQWASLLPQVSKALLEPNVVALDRALNAVQQFLEYAPLAMCKELAVSGAQTLVTKALATPRNGPKVQEVLVQMIEAEAGEHVVRELVAGMASKNGKQAEAAAQTARQALMLLGPGATHARQQLVPACIALFDSSSAAVRTEALALTRQLTLMLGPHIRPLFDSLRPIQRNEVDQMMALLPQGAGKAAALRVVRSERKTSLPSTDASTMLHSSEATSAPTAGHEPATAAGDDESEDMGVGEGEEVLSKLGKDWPGKVLAARKWQDKKVLLDKLLSVTAGRRLAAADYSEVVKTLRVLMADSMVLVVAAAIKAIVQMAAGLGPDFNLHARGLTVVLLDKLKDTNRAVVEAVQTCLDTFLLKKCTCVAEISEYLCAALRRSSNPKIRAQVLKFLARAFGHRKLWEGAGRRVTIETPLCDAVLGCLEDGALDVRETAMSAADAMMRLAGPSVLVSRIEQVELEPKRRAKLLQLAQTHTPIV